MRFCQPHWDKLRAAIDDAGMAGLVANDGHQAAAQLASGLQNGSTAANFDPLMAAHNMLMANALEMAGFVIVVGHGCPLCFLNQDHAARCEDLSCARDDFEHWIGFAVRDAKAEAIRLGLVGAS